MNELARDTWQAMSLAERSVVCNPHSDKIYLTKTDPIDQMVEDALRATGQMGITHRYKRALTNVLHLYHVQ